MASAPTGCFKCGQTGHWSRDCPSQTKPTNGTNSTNGTKGTNGTNGANDFTNTFKDSTFNSKNPNSGASTGSKKRKRPKLTPDLLTSCEGIGYIERNFPKTVTIKGKGHELGDLRRLLDAYTRWHALFYPSLTFPEFIKKVEKLGTSRVVRNSLRDMRDQADEREKERVEGGLPRPAEDTRGDGGVPNTAGDSNDSHDDVFDNDVFDDEPDDLFEEMIREANKESSKPADRGPPASSAKDLSPNGPKTGTETATGTKDPIGTASATGTGTGGLTKEQRERMEMNRKLALERVMLRTAAAKNVDPVSAPGPAKTGPSRECETDNNVRGMSNDVLRSTVDSSPPTSRNPGEKSELFVDTEVPTEQAQAFVTERQEMKAKRKVVHLWPLYEEDGGSEKFVKQNTGQNLGDTKESSSLQTPGLPMDFEKREVRDTPTNGKATTTTEERKEEMKEGGKEGREEAVTLDGSRIRTRLSSFDQNDCLEDDLGLEKNSPVEHIVRKRRLLRKGPAMNIETEKGEKKGDKGSGRPRRQVFFDDEDD